MRTTIIYGILLAAGNSTRMGQPKQLLDWGGRALVRHSAEQALASRLDGLVVVVGAAAKATSRTLAGLPRLVVVENRAYASGQASSLQAGLSALPAEAEAALVLLVDQPLVTPQLIDSLLAAYVANPAALAVVPRYRGQRGNPVLIARPLFATLAELRGDVGARAVVQANAACVIWLESDDPAVVTDVDTLQDYEALLNPTK